MTEIKWIKLTTNMFDDEKIRLIEAMPDADTLLIIWVKLLCLAGKVNADGQIFLAADLPYSDENLATLFNRPINTIRLALATFRRLHMIELDSEGVIVLLNWAKHQSIEALEQIREQNRLRQQRYYDRQKQKQLPEPEQPNVRLTLTNGTEGEGRGESENKNKNKSSSNTATATFFNKILEIYQEGYGQVTPAIKKRLVALLDTYGLAFLQDALQEGIDHGKTNLAYVTAILKAWQANGHPDTRSVSAPAPTKKVPQPVDPDTFLPIPKERPDRSRFLSALPKAEGGE